VLDHIRRVGHSGSVAPTGGEKSGQVEETRRLVLRFGWNATAYQLVNPGITLWFDAHREAVIGYVRKHRTRVVAGAPVCSLDRLPSLVDEWEYLASRRGDKVCYFGAAGRIRKLLQGCAGYSTVVLGSQPVWDPQRWAETVGAVPSLRQQFNRARNKGVTVEEWPAKRANGDPDLKRVLGQWLETRGLPPLHFLVEPETLSLLDGRRIFVASVHGEVVGFLVASPIPVRNGWLTEQFVRGWRAPNGTVELLVDFMVRSMAESGSTYVTMGLVPLSTRGVSLPEDNPLWLRGLTRWVRAHGRRFYNFGGLEAFKAKFRPHSWEAIYAISNETRFSFRTLYAIAAAFTKSPPWLAVLRGMLRALRLEIRWLVGRDHPSP
jgi:phosphatidylglycerol lysyltransferase